MSDFEAAEPPTDFARAVGRRLRAVRRAKNLSLDEVERQSGGRWSASAVGAYERGFRNLSLPRLRELAQFFGVPMSVLLGETDTGVRPRDRRRRLMLDLTALDGEDEAQPVARYVQALIHERGDYNGRVFTVRQDDIRALCAVLSVDEDGLFERLERWGALAAGGEDEERAERRRSR
ncbi:MAG: transcriptional regulator [Acidimicrobiales bacterium]